MNALQLWLLFVVMPNIGIALGFGTVICLIASIFIAIPGAVETDEEEKLFFRKVFKKTITGLIICSSLCALMPNSKQVALIVGSSYITNQEGLQEIPQKGLKLLNKYLDEALRDEK